MVCKKLCMTAPTASHTLDGRELPGPMKPMGHNVLVRVAEAAGKTTGGLILASAAKEKPTYGEAVEVGPGKRFGNGIAIPMGVEKGDIVLYGKYGGTDVEYDGEDCTIVTQDDILCKLRGGEYSAAAVEPLWDRVLVKVDAASEESSKGIIIAKNATEKSTSGTIVAMGPGRFMENGEMEDKMFKMGECVLYGKYAGGAVEFDGVEYMVVRVSDIFAKY